MTQPQDGTLDAAHATAQPISLDRKHRPRRSRAEHLGWKMADPRELRRSDAFILLMGILAGHHISIPVETFRGFAIADSWPPFVLMHDQDDYV